MYNIYKYIRIYHTMVKKIITYFPEISKENIILKLLL